MRHNASTGAPRALIGPLTQSACTGAPRALIGSLELHIGPSEAENILFFLVTHVNENDILLGTFPRSRRFQWRCISWVYPRSAPVCPQVAVALRAMGLPPTAPIYVASGELFGGPKALVALKSSFRSVFNKQSMAASSDALGSTQDLTDTVRHSTDSMGYSTLGRQHSAGSMGYSTVGRQHSAGSTKGSKGRSETAKALRQLLSTTSQTEGQGTGQLGRGRVGAKGDGGIGLSSPMLLAAVDYEVCRRATLFVANNNGNMARLLTGHRRCVAPHHGTTKTIAE